MEECPDALRAFLYVPESTVVKPPEIDLSGFSCGSETYQTPLNDWLKFGWKADYESGLRFRVWLYFTSGGVLAGYSSLGMAPVRYPTKKSDRVPLFVIPNLALDSRFQGQPAGGEKRCRYSRQIIDHVLAEAADTQVESSGPKMIVLFVHPENKRAIKFYRDVEFDDFHAVSKDGAISYRSMIRPVPSTE